MTWIAEQHNTSELYFDCVRETIKTKDFGNMKKDSRYCNVVGMSNESQVRFWEELYKNNETLLTNLDKIKRNDIYEPNQMCDTFFGRISPSTFRYFNTCMEISNYFKFDKKIDVLEIGIGYGGLSYLMNCFQNINEYKLVDVDIVKDLATLYLNELCVYNTKKEHDGVSDLLISEFCFSEFDDNTMLGFYDNYISKTKNFYLMMNLHDENRKANWKRKLEELFILEEYKETPITSWPNYIWFGRLK